MNKNDIARSIKNLTASQREAQDIVNAIFQKIAETLKSDEKVTITNFGTFNVFITKLKKGRNPKTGAEVLISPMKKIRFKPSKCFFDENADIKKENKND